MRFCSRVSVVTLCLMAVATGRAFAEPMFLTKQHSRCGTCHYSPTGGGLLTPYGRSLSHRELSTTGDRSGVDPKATSETHGEEAFLWGALGDTLGPVHLGIEMRPSHLEYSFGGFDDGRSLWMNADLVAAFRVSDWTLYGEIGRQPVSPGAEIDSYEYRVGRQPEAGIGFRVGRYLPAYGVRFADHTFYNRAYLGFEKHDQVYGLEVSQATERYLMQVTVSPGRADSIIDDDGRRAFTSTGRFQIDLTPRNVLVVSGLYRHSSRLEPRSAAGGVAFGFAPVSRLTIWNQMDASWRSGISEPSYLFVNETAIEAFRGLWVKVSPQLRTEAGSVTPGLRRLLLGVDLLPRTHWNVNLSYYRDRNVTNDLLTKILLVQLHLYL